MADKTGKTWMSIGETDDPNAVIECLEAAADITKGDPVYMSEDHKVSPAGGAQDCVGIAVTDADMGAQAAFLTSGRVKVTAGGAIALGKAVYGADATQRVLELSDQDVCEGGSDDYTIYYNRKLGTALEAASNADDLIFINVEKK